MTPTEEISIILKWLPHGKMDDLTWMIQSRVKNLTPAWLEAFKRFLVEKVSGVLEWESKMEEAIAAILNGTWNPSDQIDKDRENDDQFKQVA